MVKAAAPSWTKEVARKGFRAYGAVTAHGRPLPDYLIIGTKRGGTTSLWRNLQSHADVLPLFPASENVKSPHYFDIHWERGERWYRSHFPRRDRSRDLPDARQVLVGEASPYYMFHPLAAERVARTLPEVRLIVLLRHPSERAFSHYRERVKEGTERLDFASALQEEQHRLHGEEERIRSEPGYYSRAHDHSSYLARSRYLEHLEPWLERFDARSMLILRSEDMYQDMSSTLHRVHEFLDLAPQARPRLEHMNDLGPSHLDQADRDRLDDYFRPSVRALEQRLGRSFDWL
jgi:hypothetical protein